MTENVPVLVVGGSLVGLSAATFLAWNGVACQLVERHAGTHPHQRATGYYPRTMELLRAVGAEEMLRDVAGIEADRRIRVKVESFYGKVLKRFDLPEADDLSAVTPSPPVVTDQSIVETVLRRRAEQLGVDTRFGVEMISFAQDDHGVTVVLRDHSTGQRRQVRADHLIAADGGDSVVRDSLGIGASGPGTLAHYLNIYFRADLSGPLDPRQLVVCQIENDQVRGFFGYDTNDVGMLIVSYRPEAGEKLSDFTDQRCLHLIRAAMGVDDLAVKLIGRTPWKMAGSVALRFRERRVFLVGDAATVVPPVGGYGANTGIHAAHNLAWKLAAVHNGEAGPALLDTYDEERRPIAEFVLGQALAQLAARIGAKPGQRRDVLVGDLAVSLGYRYASGAFVGESGPAWVARPPAELDGRPGTRAPHVWLRRDRTRISSLDLFGPHFTLLVGRHGGPWIEALRRAARRGGPFIRARGIDTGDRLTSVDGQWHERYGITSSGACLVRPDGFVAWRAATSVREPEHAINRALSDMRYVNHATGGE